MLVVVWRVARRLVYTPHHLRTRRGRGAGRTLAFRRRCCSTCLCDIRDCAPIHAAVRPPHNRCRALRGAGGWGGTVARLSRALGPQRRVGTGSEPERSRRAPATEAKPSLVLGECADSPGADGVRWAFAGAGREAIGWELGVTGAEEGREKRREAAAPQAPVPLPLPQRTSAAVGMLFGKTGARSVLSYRLAVPTGRVVSIKVSSGGVLS